MDNMNLYRESFQKIFSISASELETLEYQGIPEWDSISHMELMTILETNFSIEMDIDDIIDFSSFKKGKLILNKYGIEF